MWATHGLAVALALSVLPASRALRPGDCEGKAEWGVRALWPEPNQTPKPPPTCGAEPNQTTKRLRGWG